jgi:hypothetical protein
MTFVSPRYITLICAITLAACTCFALLAINHHSSSSTGRVIFILNIIVVAILIVALVVSVIMRVLADQGQKPQPHQSTIVDLAVFTTKSRSFAAADVCPICLVELSDSASLRMNCCTKHIHEQCLSTYCSTHVFTHRTVPQCPLCREYLPLYTGDAISA